MGMMYPTMRLGFSNDFISVMVFDISNIFLEILDVFLCASDIRPLADPEGGPIWRPQLYSLEAPL